MLTKCTFYCGFIKRDNLGGAQSWRVGRVYVCLSLLTMKSEFRTMSYASLLSAGKRSSVMVGVSFMVQQRDWFLKHELFSLIFSWFRT